MTFEDAMTYLYDRLPVFHHIGHRAYKPGLETTLALCDKLGNPQENYATIHVAGTNGKGSVSNMLAAILQKAGYKTGLYTSPHLKHFTERIRVNGEPVTESYIASFVDNHKAYIETVNPSFFEVTVAMAFDYFSLQEVDVAVIEVGLGGRLDSTNVIRPILSVITNIGLDHMRQLGDTLPLIAREKAGIIKPGIPVVISEKQEKEITDVWEAVAAEKRAPLYYGTDYGLIKKEELTGNKLVLEIDKTNNDKNTKSISISLDLTGNYQKKNLLGVLSAVDRLHDAGWKITPENVREALASVVPVSGFKGRWTTVMERPFVVADTAHNLPGFKDAVGQFCAIPSARRHFVLGFVADKDIASMLKILPADAFYYFCAPSNSRALSPVSLLEQAGTTGLKGNAFPDVNTALEAAVKISTPEDTIYVGGSTFVVADLHLL